MLGGLRHERNTDFAAVAIDGFARMHLGDELGQLVGSSGVRAETKYCFGGYHLYCFSLTYIG